MNSGLLFPSLTAALLALPAAAWADRNPDFENDALPILQHQHGLAQYVHTHYVVKETGIAQTPGATNQAPPPPYIFSAKPRGVSGPFYLRLLIQPGAPGHILKVADIRKLPGGAPSLQETVPTPAGSPTETAPTVPSAPDQPPASPASSTDSTATPAPSSSTPPTSSTPSGPIRD